MHLRNIFRFIKADHFFPVYAPTVINYKRKISGRNGRGNPIELAPEDINLIIRGIHKMVNEITVPQEIINPKKKK